MSAYQALKKFVNVTRKTQQDITYDNYYFKCDKKTLNQQDYEMTSTEENILHGLYLLYETKLDGVLGKIFRDAREVEFQKDFYTKLFIYDKIYQVEKASGDENGISKLVYKNYVVEFNTASNIDGEQSPKRAMDMFQDFAKEELKNDKEFLEIINTFCNSQIKLTFSSSKEETTIEEEKADNNKKHAKVIDFNKRKK